MSRKPLIAGNWKMNLDHLEAIANIQKLAFSLPKEYYDLVDVAVTVPFTDIRSVQTLVHGDKLPITFGAQDVSEHASGAYTGEVSAAMLARLGCTWAVVGHSERRSYHGEDDACVSRKAKAALAEGVSPIVCVGEPLEVRERGEHIDYVVAQLRGSLAGLNEDELRRCVIAYEPVWAIGTGKTASAEDAQEVAQAIRKALSTGADEIRLLYGGSMKTGNAAELLAQPDVDGGLVGGASLDGKGFAELIAAAASTIR